MCSRLTIPMRATPPSISSPIARHLVSRPDDARRGARGIDDDGQSPFPPQRKDSSSAASSLPEPTDEQIEAARRNGRGLTRKLPDNWACPCCDRTVREIVS